MSSPFTATHNPLFPRNQFHSRHIGHSAAEISAMIKAVGVESLDQLIEETIPSNIRLNRSLNLPAALTEQELLDHVKQLGSKNKIYKSYIGMGYTDTHTPTVILRNILENPAWYTAYTPYQAEIAQGRMEMLINYQTLVMELTGMPIANASLLDEPTAAAEAMAMLYHHKKPSKKAASVYLVSDKLHPQTIEVLTTRATPIGIQIEVTNFLTADITRADVFGAMVQYPDTEGFTTDLSAFISAAHENDVTVCVATDLLSLTLLTPPGEMGADVVVGCSQRFGVPMGYGGPHAAFFSTREEFKRNLPGRIIGVSVDAHGNKAYRMALQTREQHIRREKATSNICTAQVLLSVMAAAYAVYHGPDGLREIATRVNNLTRLAHSLLTENGFKVVHEHYFDTIKVEVSDEAAIQARALAGEMNFRYYGTGHIGLTFDETTTPDDVIAIVNAIAGTEVHLASVDFRTHVNRFNPIQDKLVRKSAYMTHPVFNTYHSEHEMLRYLKRLENKDLSLVHSMISLGSCTMKLNATTEMIPVTMPEFGKLHPFIPVDQAAGYFELFADLENWLTDITGFAATSLQPNSGAQGEYAGLLTIRAYHESRGEGHRNIALIPSSAHGTNPASAVMAGMKVVVVKCDDLGNIDIADLKARAEEHGSNLSALMVTYPSTHGVFEESIIEICETIHQYGGQVYMDGANMNAQVGLTSPGNIGADVCHLNLHKTFCIPHGGGGPGMGPICVAAHLAPFLPGHGIIPIKGQTITTAVSAAPYGSASILLISYAYIRMMGPEGLKYATEIAILNANYIKAMLENDFKILYTNHNGRCAHEMIVDLRMFKQHGIEAEDIAKRLMDYGYHAPTLSFPVAGTIMIEPTESESKAELERFCDALLGIRAEMEAIVNGTADKHDNLLKNAPHTASVALATDWNHSYTREEAVYPKAWVKEAKFWPTVSRIDSAYGDRNLMCSCIPVEEYAEAEQA
jgi:glycine dehydrogenase